MRFLKITGWYTIASLLTVTAQAQTDFNNYYLNLPGIVSHWGMEEARGSSVSDTIKSDTVDGNNPGTITSGMGASLNVSGPRPSDGFAGLSASNSAINFAGTAGQRLDMGMATGNGVLSGYTGPTGLTAMSLGAWFRLTAPASSNKHHHLGGLELEANGASSRYAFAINNYAQSNAQGSASERGGLRALARSGSPSDEVGYQTGYTTTQGNMSFWDSKWHFVVSTYEPFGADRRLLRMYVDGALLQRNTIPDTSTDTLALSDPIAPRDTLVFGEDAGDSSRLWVGQLDEIATFSRALTGAEVGIAYLAAKGITVNHALLPTRGVSAHRGANAIHPENTVAALREAVNVGSHQVEFDVQLTSDGKLVLMHDSTINRTTNGTGRVRDYTLAQLKALDAGSWKDTAFAGESIPTLEEALEALPLNMWLNVEVKGVGGNEAATAQAAAAVLQAKGRLHQSMISGNKTTAAAVRSYETANEVDIRLNNLDREGGDTTDYVNYTINNGYDFIQIRSNYPFPNAAEVQALHAAGVQNNYFYDNDPADFAGFLQSGMDFVLTDDPALVMGAAVAEGIVPLRAIYRGDFNMDGATDTKDFGLFFQALVDPAGFAASNPGFDSNIYGDYDTSQLFDVQDYEGFYQAVTGGASIAGDYNLDGTVDASDYAVWKSAFGLASSNSLVPADGNGDGVVDLADYTVWRDNLGASNTNLSLNAATAMVPEPTTIVMGMSMLVAGLTFRRHHERSVDEKELPPAISRRA